MTDGVDDDVVARAERALADVGRDPRAALAEADAVVQLIPRPRTPEGVRAVATAHRAAALALRETGEAAEARARLRTAVRAAHRLDQPSIEAECLVTLAFLESEAGRTAEAMRILDRVPDGLGDTVALRVMTTRALVLQRTGKHAESLAHYKAALDLAEAVGDAVRRARLLNNRAMALAYLGRTEQSLADLETAATSLGDSGAPALAAQAFANAAWVVGMAGDVPRALAYFDRSERTAPEADHAEMWSDRAEVYLRAGLGRDALRSAVQSVSWLRGQGWGASEAEALLLLARCELELGDETEAAAHARESLSMLRRQGRQSWMPLAHYVLVTARTRRGVAGPAEVLAVSQALDDAGWTLASLDLVVAAAATAVSTGRRPAARRLLETVGGRGSHRPEISGRRHLAEALRREIDDDHTRAQASLAAAFARIEERRALLGAADLRALSSTLASDVVSAGVRVAESSGSVRDLFTWAERSRSAAFRYRPAVPVDDARLQSLLTRLRWASRAVEDARLADRADPAAAAEMARCEGEILRMSRRSRGAPRRSGRRRAPRSARLCTTGRSSTTSCTRDWSCP